MAIKYNYVSYLERGFHKYHRKSLVPATIMCSVTVDLK
jgi:hypothetical protein